jgi:hypothetical protein
MLLMTITRDSGTVYVRRDADGQHYTILDGKVLHANLTVVEVAVYLRETALVEVL